MREPANLRESVVEIGQEAAYGRSILVDRTGLPGEGQRLKLRFEDLFESG